MAAQLIEVKSVLCISLGFFAKHTSVSVQLPLWLNINKEGGAIL